jgi:hypothetical protein
MDRDLDGLRPQENAGQQERCSEDPEPFTGVEGHGKS